VRNGIEMNWCWFEYPR